MAWQDEMWKGRDEDLQKFGEGTSGAFKVAAGWYGDDAKKLGKAFTPAVNMMLPEHVDIGSLDKQWVGEQSIIDKDWHDQKMDVGNLDKTEDRLKLMNAMTQNVEGDSSGQGMCGATVLLAAAIKGGGNKGIQTILDQVKKGQIPGDDMGKMKMKDLQDKLTSGKLTTEDLDQLGGELNYQLRNKQFDKEQKLKKEDPDYKPSTAGLDPDTLKDFVNASPDMKNYFKQNNMSIDSVDSDNKDGANHYVLSMGGENGVVYDPFARKDGNQVVFNPVEIKNYHQNETKSDRIDANDFGGPFKGMYD